MGIFNRNQNETAFVGGKKHWTDVIKNTGPGESLLWRQPEEDFNTNSTLIVMPGEEAIFIKNGNIEQVFESGTYKLSTENYPFISRLRNAFSGGISTFNCVVYFVRKAHTKELKWGTDSPIQVRDKFLGIATKVRARGIYKVQVSNPSVFLEKLIGSNISIQGQGDLYKYFTYQFQSKIKTLLTKELNELETELLGIEARLDEFSSKLSPAIHEIFFDYGLSCINFSIAALDIEDDELRKRYDEIGIGAFETVKMAQAEKLAKIETAHGDKAAMDILGDDWARLQAAGILGDLANNSGAGGIASAGAGLGMSLAAGGAFGNMAQQMFDPMKAVSDGKRGVTTPEPDRFVQKNNDDKAKEDPVVKIKQLKEMLDIGAISKEEFDSKKKEILDRF